MKSPDSHQSSGTRQPSNGRKGHPMDLEPLFGANLLTHIAPEKMRISSCWWITPRCSLVAAVLGLVEIKIRILSQRCNHMVANKRVRCAAMDA